MACGGRLKDILRTIFEGSCPWLRMIAAQRNEGFEKRWEIFVPLREVGRLVSADGRLLADKLNINLLSVLQIEIEQFIETWLPRKFSGGIRLVVAVESI